MKITFLGVPGEQIDEISAYGYQFQKGKSVDVTDKLALMKLSNHPHFKGGDVPIEYLIQPQTIPAVAQTTLVSDGHQSTTTDEVAAINADARMLPGYQVTAEQVLKAKGDAAGEDFRVEPPVHDAFVEVGSTRFSDGKVQTKKTLAKSAAEWEAMQSAPAVD